MATERLTAGFAPTARTGLDIRIAEIGFVLLQLLILVGLTPFDDRTTAALAARDAASAAGDAMRQVAFVSTFALILYSSARTRGLAAIRAVPLFVAALLVWCFLSTLWNPEPDVVMRRAVLATIFVLSVLLAVDTLGPSRTMTLWRNILAVIIVADVASVFVVHNAIHQPDDLEAGLAGAWRGLHSHKNMAGSVAVSAVIVFLYSWLEERKRSDLLLCLLSFFFLVMTRSKSSLGLLPVALAAGGLYRIAARNVLDRTIAATAAALLLVVGGLAITLAWDWVAQIFEDPQHFTGRTAIWSAELLYIRDHPLFGAGLGAFGNTGMRSPIYPYVGAGWVAHIGEGHSGYLEMLVTLGGIGFAVGMAGLIVRPFLQFWSTSRRHTYLDAMLFSLFAFEVLHNFMESDFVQVTSAQWGQMLMVIALLRATGRQTA